MFVQRAIELKFEKYLEGGKKESQVDLFGHRVELSMNSGGAYNMYAVLNMRVYGMTIEDMREYSTNFEARFLAKENRVYVSAGNYGEDISQIFEGNITQAYIDYQAAPEVSFNVSAVSSFYYQNVAAAPHENQEPYSVKDKAESLAKAMGLAFKSTDVKVMSNLYLWGSPRDQLKDLMFYSKVNHKISNGTLYIWNNGETIDDIIIEISPDNGMIGYPQFLPVGFIIRTEFKPEVETGRKIRVSGSAVEEANGDLYVQKIQHDLTTFIPNGPWFTTIQAAKDGIYASN